MLYCANYKELFGENKIAVYKNGTKVDQFINGELYDFIDERLYIFGKPARVEKVYEYKNGEFKLLYEKPNLLDISTIIKNGDFIKVKFADNYELIGIVVGDKIYYKNGGFDELKITIGNPRYIEEIRRPNSYNGGFNDYDDMPVIWSKNT